MELRVLIVAEHASARFGGEAALPLHYFRVLRSRNIPAWLVTHERTRSELESLFPHDGDRMTFVPDTPWHRLLWRLSCWLPARLSGFTLGFAMRLLTQLYQRRLVRRLVTEMGISVIHQPIPVSPKEPSMMFGMGVPVVIGPMNGGMDYPRAFAHLQSWPEHLALAAGRWLAELMNRLIPGKRQAAMLLVANERTRQALPRGARARVAMLVENGVDLALWKPGARSTYAAVTRYVFVGRLVDWKAVDLLLVAFARARVHALMTLQVIGDGPERSKLDKLARALDLLEVAGGAPAGKVRFCGWLSQPDCAEKLRDCDALVLPSLMECGGAVVLEAMAMEIPVIAAAWGGPLDYLDDSCGVLIEPASQEAFVGELASALVRLAKSPQERVAMGRAGRAKVIRLFNWEVKVDRMLNVYRGLTA